MLTTTGRRSFSDLSIFTPPNSTSQILHITDCEGSEAFFKAINNSSIVKYDPVNGLSFHQTEGTPYFIFGGDVTDRGNHDLAITRLLVEFKKRHPENVFLIAGNRELIKCRFKIELAPELIRARLLKTVQPHWITQATLPLDYVKARMSAENSQQSVEDYVNSLSIAQCQIIYLKWMLEKTMGCPHSFRYRREELARSQNSKLISDEDILQSFLEQTSPEGVTGQYLQLAQIGVIVPGTGVMSVHGGLQPTSIGRHPGMKPEAGRIANAKCWINQFNAWYQEQIRYWIDFRPAELTRPACTPLDDCILQPANVPKTVITDWMLNKERQFVDVAPEVSRYLHDNKINVVLTGHQPSGDHPVVLRSAHNAVFVNGDTGYAAFSASDPDDTRGAAIHTLEVDASMANASISINAVLPDNTQVTTRLSIKPDGIEGDPYVGKVSQDHQLVQCRLPNGDYRLICQKGFQTQYAVMPASEIGNIFASQPVMKAS